MKLTSLTMPWADAEYTFDLKLEQMRNVQEKTGFGPARLVKNLQGDEWKIDEYREVILQGLLGAGMELDKARPLIRKWVDQRPAKESILPATLILMAFIVGGPEPKKDPTPEPKVETPTETQAKTMEPVA